MEQEGGRRLLLLSMRSVRPFSMLFILAETCSDVNAGRQENGMDLSRARILIIRLSAIGDVLHATPVARALRRALPQAYIAWLASPPASELVASCAEVDETIVWDRRPFDRAVAQGRIVRALRLLREARALLKERRFDIVLDVQDLLLTGVLAYLSGAGCRIGVRERHEGAGFFMTQKAPRLEEPHKVRRYLAALAPLGIAHEDVRITLQLPAALAGFAAPFFAAHAVTGARAILLVSLCTTWRSKEWPPERFVAALAALEEDVQIVFLGSSADRPVIRAAMERLALFWRGRAVSVAGETSLLETAALMKAATLLLCPDTGPLHIAAAVGLPTLSLWGPTRPAIYGPLHGQNFFIETPHPCAPCCKTRCPLGTNACMKAIEAQDVARRLGEALAMVRQGRASR